MTEPLQTYNLLQPNKTSPNCLADFREDARDSCKILCVSSLDHQLPLTTHYQLTVPVAMETFHPAVGLNNITKRLQVKIMQTKKCAISSALTDMIWYSNCL